MVKELEHLKILEDWANENHNSKEVYEHSIPVQEALERLEAIDNVKPSEALKCLETLGSVCPEEDVSAKEIFYEEYDTIKQSLQKAEEKNDKEIAFDLIDIKNVDIKLLKWAYPSVEAYNVKVRTEKDYWWREELTQEEFEFLGRMVGAK